MVIVGLLLIFSCVIVLVGGNNSDVSQLYYDSDFAELYNVKQDEENERKFKGGKPINSVNTSNVSAEANDLLSSQGSNVSLTKDSDSEAKDTADNIYEVIDL